MAAEVNNNIAVRTLAKPGNPCGNNVVGLHTEMELILPDEKTAAHFGRLVEPLPAEIISLARKIQNRRRTRDLLLPRWLSGQVEL